MYAIDSDLDSGELTPTVEIDQPPDDAILAEQTRCHDWGIGAAVQRPKSAFESGKVIADRYLLHTQLGSRGFEEVWRGRDLKRDTDKAIKVIFRALDPDDAQAEQLALEIISQTTHPHLLRTERFFVTNHCVVLILELAEGSLRDKVQMPAHELIASTKQAAQALDYLHEKRMIHRNVKPENLLLAGSTVKVADFALAKLADTSRAIRATFAGTPAYSSPETWTGQVASRSDQYSLAATYAELRLGHPPFKAKSIYDYMIAHLQSVPDLSGLVKAERAVLLKALSKAPELRFQSCAEFVAALEAV